MVAGAAQWPTSEALFAALKTTDPALQEAIRMARTPKAAKAIGRRVPLLENWERLKVEAMRIALCAKYAAPLSGLRTSLERSNPSKAIVEESLYDPWWGAKPQGADRLVGRNVLGTLLMELRDDAVPEGPGPVFELLGRQLRRNGTRIQSRRG